MFCSISVDVPGHNALSNTAHRKELEVSDQNQVFSGVADSRVLLFSFGLPQAGKTLLNMGVFPSYKLSGEF